MSATAADMAQYLEVDCREEGVLEAAEAMHRGFEDWDREQRAERFRQYAETLRDHWEEVADEEESGPSFYSVTVDNLSDDVTIELLHGTFSQIGEARWIVLSRCQMDVQWWCSGIQRMLLRQ